MYVNRLFGVLIGCLRCGLRVRRRKRREKRRAKGGEERERRGKRRGKKRREDVPLFPSSPLPLFPCVAVCCASVPCAVCVRGAAY
jgi:hypothetical protein